MPAPVANIKFTAENADLLNKMRQAEQQFGSVDNRVTGLTSSINSLVRVVGTYLTVQEALRLSRLAESFENARTVFGKYVEEVEIGTAKLRQATRGQVDDLKLLQLANEAFRKGLSFSEVETAFKFAELQADQARDTIEAAFNNVTTAMSRTEAATGRAAGQLVRYGINASDTVHILALMNKQLVEQGDNLDESSDAVAQFETRWTNATIKISTNIRQYLLPTFEAIGNALDKMSDTEVRGIGVALYNLQKNGYGFTKNTLGKSIIDDLEALEIKAGRGAATTEDFTAIVDKLNQALTDPATSKYAEGITVATDVLSRFIKQRTSAIENKNVKNFDPFLTPEEIAAQDEARERAAKDAQAAADKALQIKRDTLFQEREIAKAEIALGRQTYADLKTILDRQEAENQDFLNSDFQAKIAWMQDSALVYQQDRANSEKAEAEKYNTYQRYTQGVLESDKLSQEQRFQMAREAIQWQLDHENFDIERRRQLVQQKQAIEAEYTQYLVSAYQQQLDLYMNIFGQPALQLIDDFFSSGELRFEEFLKNILRMAARYAAQALLLRLFTSFIPLPGIPGADGGLPSDLLPGASIPRSGPNLIGGLPDLSGLNHRGGFGSFTPANTPPANYNLPTPQVTVQILATPEQMAALVHTGNLARNKTDLHS